MTEVLTLAGRFRHEIDKIKGSRFIATVQPAHSVEEALALVSELRNEMPDATHHGWAWRGQDRDALRYADDGEPSGSAGRPILSAIDGRKLCSVVVVVTRYFGGTKLGTGGLVRAYGGAAGAALDLAPQIRTPVATRVVLELAYAQSGPVQGHLSEHGLKPDQADYGERIRLVVQVPKERVEDFVRGLHERTAGQVQVTFEQDPTNR